MLICKPWLLATTWSNFSAMYWYLSQLEGQWSKLIKTVILTDRVIGEGNAIGRVRPSVCFRLTSDVDYCVLMGHGHSSPGIESQGLWLGFGLAGVVTRSVWPRSLTRVDREFVFCCAVRTSPFSTLFRFSVGASSAFRAERRGPAGLREPGGGAPLSAADVERRASGVIKSRFSSSGYSSYCCRGLVCSSSPLQTRAHLAATARRAAGTNELCRTHSNDSSKANWVSSAWVWRRFELTLGHIACIALMRPVATDGAAWSVCVLVTTAGLRKRRLNHSRTDSRGPKER